jgi:hypothetical protein
MAETPSRHAAQNAPYRWYRQDQYSRFNAAAGRLQTLQETLLCWQTLEN